MTFKYNKTKQKMQNVTCLPHKMWKRNYYTAVKSSHKSRIYKVQIGAHKNDHEMWLVTIKSLNA